MFPKLLKDSQILQLKFYKLTWNSLKCFTDVQHGQLGFHDSNKMMFMFVRVRIYDS